MYQESESVELKEVYVEDVRKEIIAFANTNGGTLYIGVKDNGEIVGIYDIDAVMLQVSNSCRDTIKPDITMFIAYETLEAEGKQILAIHVQRGTSRPYYLGAKGLKPSGVFVRQGTSSAPASDEAIRRMIKESDGDHFEDMRSLNQELTFDAAGRLFMLKELPFGIIQMKTLGLINDENLYTNLALLLSDQCPHIIKAATFRGNNQDDFQDRKEFTGSLIKQLEDAYSYLEMRNQTKASFKGLYRIDSKDYSDKAIREALLNAIEHRDYSFSAPTLISVFSNRIEFISYGGLAGGVQMEDVLNGLSICRNQKLANVFYRLDLVEAYGTGLSTIRNAYVGKEDQPEFYAGPSSFKAVLPNMNALGDKQSDTRVNVPSTLESEDSTDDMEKALRFIEENGEATRSEVENHLELSTSTAIRLMKKLKVRGLIMTIGHGRNVKYRIMR